MKSSLIDSAAGFVASALIMVLLTLTSRVAGSVFCIGYVLYHVWLLWPEHSPLVWGKSRRMGLRKKNAKNKKHEMRRKPRCNEQEDSWRGRG